MPLQCIHGRLKQARRQGVFYNFCNSKETVLFATDVASRGLDFPSVDWVVQADCPEDVAIHSPRRTLAGYTRHDKGLLMLTPGEAHFMKELEDAKVPLKPIKINPKKQSSRIRARCRAYCRRFRFEVSLATQPWCVTFGQCTFRRIKRFSTSRRSTSTRFRSRWVYQTRLDCVSCNRAHPRAVLTAIQTRGRRRRADGDASDDDEDDDEDDEDEDDEGDDESDESDEGDSEEEEGVPARQGRCHSEKGGGRFGLVVEQGEDDDDDFMNVKRVDHKLADSDSEDDKKYNADEKAAEIARKRALKGKLKIKESGHGANKRVVFDDEGTSMAPLQALGVKSGIDGVSAPGESLRAAVKAHYAEVAAKRKEADRVDKGREKARLREGRMRKKQKLRDVEGEDGGAEVILDGGSDLESDLDLVSESELDEREVPHKLASVVDQPSPACEETPRKN